MISHVFKFEADTINALGGDSVCSGSKIGTKWKVNCGLPVGFRGDSGMLEHLEPFLSRGPNSTKYQLLRGCLTKVIQLLWDPEQKLKQDFKFGPGRPLVKMHAT